MRAARMHGYHEPLRLEEIPVPDVGPDEVLIKVAAAGMCRSDFQQIEGYFSAGAPLSFPATPGMRSRAGSPRSALTFRAPRPSRGRFGRSRPQLGRRGVSAMSRRQRADLRQRNNAGLRAARWICRVHAGTSPQCHWCAGQSRPEARDPCAADRCRTDALPRDEETTGRRQARCRPHGRRQRYWRPRQLRRAVRQTAGRRRHRGGVRPQRRKALRGKGERRSPTVNTRDKTVEDVQNELRDSPAGAMWTRCWTAQEQRSHCVSAARFWRRRARSPRWG